MRIWNFVKGVSLVRNKKKTKKERKKGRKEKKNIKIISVNHICKKSLMTFSRYDFDAPSSGKVLGNRYQQA